MVECILVGDVMPGSRPIREQVSDSLPQFFRMADLAIGNLESPIVSSQPRKVNRDKIPLWSTADNLGVLQHFCFTHLNLNNNHTFDLYEEGLKETIDHLRTASIEPFGLNWGGLSQVTTIHRDGIRFGIITANWVEGQFTRNLSKDLRDLDIPKIRSSVDTLICSIHWGDDHNIFINQEQQQTARSLIDQGVDLVVGHHPHVPQGWEIYKGKHIFYSLGNFIFTPREEYDHLPYAVRFEDHRENMLFQRTECKIGLVVRVGFERGGGCTVENILPVFRAHTLPAAVPDNLSSFCETLLRTMNDQVRQSDFRLNDRERKRILSSYTLPLILSRPWYWPLFFKKLRIHKAVWFLKDKGGLEARSA